MDFCHLVVVVVVVVMAVVVVQVEDVVQVEGVVVPCMIGIKQILVCFWYDNKVPAMT